MGPICGQYGIQQQAAALLHAVADGDRVSLHDVRGLAVAVLNSRPVLLARAVLEAEPEFVIARAVELAASLVCQSSEVDAETTRSRGADCPAKTTDGDAK